MKQGIKLATVITVVLSIAGCVGVMNDIKDATVTFKDGTVAFKEGVQAAKEGAKALKEGVVEVAKMPSQIVSDLNPCSGGSK